MSSWSWKFGLAGLTVVAATVYAVAQMPGHTGMHEHKDRGAQDNPAMPQRDMQDRMMAGKRPLAQQGMHGGEQHHGQLMGAGAGGQPTMAGQEAFGTIQEIVRVLEADPKTDWSKVNIGALRDHLIDMNEVTLRASAIERPLDNGIEIAVTGEGRTLDAIKRMVPAHIHELNSMGWNAKTDEMPNGVKLTVTSVDTRQVTKLKALGFMGIMVQGAHHQTHHLMMAKGDFTH